MKMTCLHASLTVMQFQHTAALFPPEYTKSPTATLPRLASVNMTSPMKFEMVSSPVLSGHIAPSPVNVKNVGVLAIQPNIVATHISGPLYSVPNLAMIFSNCPVQSHLCPNCGGLIINFLGAAISTSLSLS